MFAGIIYIITHIFSVVLGGFHTFVSLLHYLPFFFLLLCAILYLSVYSSVSCYLILSSLVFLFSCFYPTLPAFDWLLAGLLLS